MSPQLNLLDKKSLRKQDMPWEQAIKEGEIMAAAEDAKTLTCVGVWRRENRGAWVSDKRFAL